MEMIKSWVTKLILSNYVGGFVRTAAAAVAGWLAANKILPAEDAATFGELVLKALPELVTFLVIWVSSIANKKMVAKSKWVVLFGLIMCSGQFAYAQTYGTSRTVCSTPVVDTGAYAPGDNIGGLITFTAALQPRSAYKSGQAPGGLVQNILFTDLGAEGKQVELCLFNANPTATTVTDQAALDIADGDITKVAGCATVSDFSSFADNGIGQVKNLSLSLASADFPIYGVLVAREAVTYDAADAVSVCITVIQD